MYRRHRILRPLAVPYRHFQWAQERLLERGNGHQRAEPGPKTPADAKPAEPKKPVIVKVDIDGLADRLISLPIAPSNESRIQP